MFSRLLLPLDGSPTAFLALDHAEALARLSGADVTLLHVIEPTRPSSGFARPKVYTRDILPGFVATGQALLEDAANRLWLVGVRAQTVLLQAWTDSAATHIVEQAEGADLIILGTHGRRGVRRLLMGSDAEQVARTAPVPVMLVRQPHLGITRTHVIANA